MDVPETVITFVAGTILAGIGAGFKVMWDTIRTAAAKCEADREKLWIKVDELEGRQNSCPQPACPQRQAWQAPQTATGNGAPGGAIASPG